MRAADASAILRLRPAVAVFLALAPLGMTSLDAATVRSVYIVMEPLISRIGV